MTCSEARIVNALTVDVEDYYHVTGYARSIATDAWDTYESRVENNTRRLLDVLARYRARATFFFLGWVADRHPELVRAVHAAGHEIAYHSYWHRLVYDQTPEEFRADLRHGRALLEDIVGARVTGFRAPSFSVTQRSLWALEVLAEEGYRHDSSIFPIRHDRYGIPTAERFPHAIETGSGTVWEFPGSVYRLGNYNMPVGGGGYFRLYPAFVSFYCLDYINRALGRPFNFYVHPWEIDPEQPVLPGSPWARFRHRVNLAKTEEKLGRLLGQFRFDAMGAILDGLARPVPADGATNNGSGAHAGVRAKTITLQSMRGERTPV